VKPWPLRSRLSFWTALLLSVELVIFGAASGWVIYREQFEAFRQIKNEPSSPVVIRKEAAQLIVDLAGAYVAALPVVVLVAALGVWWITRRALRPLEAVADAAEQIHAKSLDQRLPQAARQDEIGRVVRVLNATFDRLERSFAQATRFSSDASHELRTPLTIMRGEIESALRTEIGNPRIEDLLDDLLEQTQRLSGIAEKLLLLSRADAGALTLKQEVLDMSGMCHDLVDDAEILAMRQKITTEQQISPGVSVYADEAYLRQLLLNLLDNAIQYNIEGGTISISLSNSSRLVSFRIANSGPEIPVEHENRIFERFYRADVSRTSDSVGYGLGLSICREIVLAHKGQIWLERPQPGWTAFVFTLPRAVPELNRKPVELSA
jgi:two-component system, OmpR family, heavy metal sensor histidine kinase CusS